MAETIQKLTVYENCKPRDKNRARIDITYFRDAIYT